MQESPEKHCPATLFIILLSGISIKGEKDSLAAYGMHILVVCREEALMKRERRDFSIWR